MHCGDRWTAPMHKAVLQQQINDKNALMLDTGLSSAAIY